MRHRSTGEAHYDAVDAVLGRPLDGKIEVLNDLEHFSIPIEDVRDELSNTASSRNADELLKKQRTRAAMLVLVGHRESQFGALGGGGYPNEPTDGDQSLTAFFVDRYGPRHVIAKIELRKHPQLLRRRRVFRMEETTIDGPGRQALEGDSQAFLVVRSNRTYANRCAIAQLATKANASAARIRVHGRSEERR